MDLFSAASLDNLRFFFLLGTIGGVLELGLVEVVEAVEVINVVEVEGAMLLLTIFVWRILGLGVKLSVVEPAVS